MSGENEAMCRYCNRISLHLPLSKERRKFIIVVAFDSVLITSLWILCTVKKGGKSWWEDFLGEMNFFDPQFFEHSLFDLVLLANLRVIILLFYYVALRCAHWTPVALCTAVSSLFTVVKIVLFFGQRHHLDNFPHYLLVVASLLIVWFELWLMPFRVLNAERGLDEFVFPYQHHHTSPSAESALQNADTVGLIASNGTRQSSPRCACASIALRHSTTTILQPVNNTYRAQSISEDEFHSALEYSSNDEEQSHITKDAQSTHSGHGAVLHTRVGQILRQECLRLAEDARLEASALLSIAATWRVIHAREPIIRVNDAINTYYMRAELCGVPPRRVFNAIWWKTQSWNKNVREFRVLNCIDGRTDVILCTTMPALGGYVSQRHFVDVRRYNYDSTTDSFFGFYTSVEANGRSNEKHEIWGKNGVNAMRVTPLTSATGSDACLFEWLMNTDLQGAIPRVLMRRTMSSFLCEYVRSLEQFLRSDASKESPSISAKSFVSAPSSQFRMSQ